MTLRGMHRPPQARFRYLPHAAAHKLPEYGILCAGGSRVRCLRSCASRTTVTGVWGQYPEGKGRGLLGLQRVLLHNCDMGYEV